MTSICNRCGMDVPVGSWFDCPHEPYRGTAIGDDIPGGQVIENLGHEPMTFYSKKAIRDEADRRGLRLTDKWAGPHDKYLTNWAAAIDPQTLENARILTERQRAAKSPSYEGESIQCETAQFTVTDITHVD